MFRLGVKLVSSLACSVSCYFSCSHLFAWQLRLLLKVSIVHSWGSVCCESAAVVSPSLSLKFSKQLRIGILRTKCTSAQWQPANHSISDNPFSSACCSSMPGLPWQPEPALVLRSGRCRTPIISQEPAEVGKHLIWLFKKRAYYHL